MSGEQTVGLSRITILGLGRITISVGRMVDPIDGPVCETALRSDPTSYNSVEGRPNRSQSPSTKAESRL
jgi:hypothetical protein